VLTAELKNHSDRVWGAAFSPDGTQIVTASADGKAWIWNRNAREDSYTPAIELKGHGDRVLSAAFRFDGSQIVTASADGTARVWNLDGTERRRLRHLKPVNRAAFSRDGRWIVTASDDGTARIWNAEDGSERFVLFNEEPVRDAAFSPDASTVVTGDYTGRVRLWTLSLTTLVERLSRATTACVTVEARMRLLGESASTATSRHQDCELRYGRRSQTAGGK
jgi:WD40 repeat protein